MQGLDLKLHTELFTFIFNFQYSIFPPPTELSDEEWLHTFLFRCQSSSSTSAPSELDSSSLQIREASLEQMKPKPPLDKLAFGKVFTDHMLTIDWNKEKGWAAPQITPFENFSMHPGAKVLGFYCN